MNGRKPLSALLVACLALGAFPTFGQDKSAFPFVDMGRAQALIDVLTKENETLKAEALRLRQEAADWNTRAIAAQKGTSELVVLLNASRARYSELATIDAEIVDTGLKARSVAALERALALVKRLARRVDELGGQAADLAKEIEVRLAQASVDEARLARNTDDIILLQATLARTKAQQGRLDAVMGELDALATKAAALPQ